MSETTITGWSFDKRDATEPRGRPLLLRDVHPHKTQGQSPGVLDKRALSMRPRFFYVNFSDRRTLLLPPGCGTSYCLPWQQPHGSASNRPVVTRVMLEYKQYFVILEPAACHHLEVVSQRDGSVIRSSLRGNTHLLCSCFISFNGKPVRRFFLSLLFMTS